jgi:hypothetical protein
MLQQIGKLVKIMKLAGIVKLNEWRCYCIRTQLQNRHDNRAVLQCRRSITAGPQFGGTISTVGHAKYQGLFNFTLGCLFK